MRETESIIKTLRDKLNGVPHPHGTLPRALPLKPEQIFYDKENGRYYVKSDDVLDAISAALETGK